MFRVLFVSPWTILIPLLVIRVPPPPTGGERQFNEMLIKCVEMYALGFNIV